MNTKKAIIISILGSIIYLVFGWLFFDLLLGEYTNTHTTNIEGFKKSEAEFSFLFLYISCFAYSVLITYILVFLTKTQCLLQGFLRASIIGALIAIMTDTYWYGSSNFYNNIIVMIMDILAAAITVGVLGLSIVWLYMKLNKHHEAGTKQ
ncbi:MAG: hypothetical protein J0L87_01095 [Bacteroidetes bacterium]|nr:hypothetical protein [Bacteroidota bacterium]